MARFNASTVDRLSLPTSTQINVDAAESVANLQALDAALNSIILGSAVRGVRTVDEVIDGGSAVPPVDVDANRGSKWLFRSQDSVTSEIFTNELGTADLSILPSSTTDFIDLSAGTGLALKNAWDAVYETKNGNTGVLLSVQQVTRTE